MSTHPIALVDVEDLAEADLEDELTERLADLAAALAAADAVTVAGAVRAGAAAALLAHDLDRRAASLALG
ncbi:hypothetical protein [Geodermatophilus marinus]|uniref:hypothetical protein n=1 Tax=Geodermatophilus sp. LHW52908 TaxID=2303986 RepID=UPI000E3D2F1F|nr:hypothetical protein [Geodermatophilus sp. LHW52908]RFU19692.1 hypothetical protein D0Z06_20180 [Geodermatophilus sp. LHW52908]